MFDHKQTFGHVSAHIARLLANRLRDGLAPLGLLPAQYTALAEIALGEGMSQKDLVERLDLEQPGVARTLTGLEAMGWIERRAGRGRLQGLYLSERARSVLPRAAAIAAAVDRLATAEFSRTERAHLLDALEELVSHARRAEPAAQ